ncbi:hypothetical protein AO265_30145 [Pseudomonas sp. ABAC61]|nr:hypothetical protein AO265_30145 [Pseudomonas sp. ABAC61]
MPFLLVGSSLITTVPTHAARAMERITSLKTFPCPVPMPSYELEIGMRVGSKHDEAMQVVKALILDCIKEHFFLQ